MTYAGKLTAVLPVICAALAAQASAVQAATYEVTAVSGIWTNVSANPDNLNGAQTNSLAFGFAASGEGQSAYVFNGLTNPSDTGLGTQISFGEFTHQNNPIFGGSLTRADLELDITIDLDDGQRRTLRTLSVVLEFDHFETPNNFNPCAAGGVVPCPDQVSASLSSSETLTFNGLSYSFGNFAFQSGSSLVSSFLTAEGANTSADIMLSLTSMPAPVPLPPSAAFLGLGVLALATMKRGEQ